FSTYPHRPQRPAARYCGLRSAHARHMTQPAAARLPFERASSSAVEQGTLNPLVVGSNPSWLTVAHPLNSYTSWLTVAGLLDSGAFTDTLSRCRTRWPSGCRSH